MSTNFIFIPTEDHQRLGRRGEWMCVHCCKFVEFSAQGFSGHMKACKSYQEFSESIVEVRQEKPITPIQLFQ